MSTIIVSLQCTPESFKFESKQITLLPCSRLLLGSVKTDSVRDPQRVASPTNGFFAAQQCPHSKGGDSIVPLSLSANHAEIWLKNNQVSFVSAD